MSEENNNSGLSDEEFERIRSEATQAANNQTISEAERNLCLSVAYELGCIKNKPEDYKKKPIHPKHPDTKVQAVIDGLRDQFNPSDAEVNNVTIGEYGVTNPVIYIYANDSAQDVKKEVDQYIGVGIAHIIGEDDDGNIETNTSGREPKSYIKIADILSKEFTLPDHLKPKEQPRWLQL